jgi:hypothetical protein
VGPGLNLKTSDSGELVLLAGSAALVSGLDAIAQAIRCRLLTFRGEWFLDESLGLPYFDEVLGLKPPRVTVARALVRDEILKVPGVTSVLEIEVAMDGGARELGIAYRIATELGELAGAV